MAEKKKGEQKKRFSKPFYKNLVCELTDTEKLQAGNDLADETNGLSMTEASFSAKKKEFGGLIDQHKAKIEIFSMAISTGREYREIECRWVYNFTEGKKDLLRMDSGEKMKTEGITERERQTDFSFDD